MLSNPKTKLTRKTNKRLEMIYTFNKERKTNKQLDMMYKKDKETIRHDVYIQ